MKKFKEFKSELEEGNADIQKQIDALQKRKVTTGGHNKRMRIDQQIARLKAKLKEDVEQVDEAISGHKTRKIGMGFLEKEQEASRAVKAWASYVGENPQIKKKADKAVSQFLGAAHKIYGEYFKFEKEKIEKRRAKKK